MCGARGSNVSVVEYLAEAVESLNGEAVDSTGATALHHAAISGHPAVITALANIPRIVLDATDKVSTKIFLIYIICFEIRDEGFSVTCQNNIEIKIVKIINLNKKYKIYTCL